MEMRQDFRKLVDAIERLCQDGVALERRIDEWKAIEVKLGENPVYRQALEEVRQAKAA